MKSDVYDEIGRRFSPPSRVLCYVIMLDIFILSLDTINESF